MMKQKIRRRFCFKGHVQGVGFRYKMYYLAQKYNATGWVQNEFDGSVTSEVQGGKSESQNKETKKTKNKTTTKT